MWQENQNLRDGVGTPLIILVDIAAQYHLSLLTLASNTRWQRKTLQLSYNSQIEKYVKWKKIPWVTHGKDLRHRTHEWLMGLRHSSHKSLMLVSLLNGINSLKVNLLMYMGIITCFLLKSKTPSDWYNLTRKSSPCIDTHLPNYYPARMRKGVKWSVVLLLLAQKSAYLEV